MPIRLLPDVHPDTTGWSITVTAVRADRPRVRTRKTYVLTDRRYHEAADCARRLAHMAGLVDVMIIGVTRLVE